METLRIIRVDLGSSGAFSVNLNSGGSPCIMTATLAQPGGVIKNIPFAALSFPAV
jgi:hypothetical protein